MPIGSAENCSSTLVPMGSVYEADVITTRSQVIGSATGVALALTIIFCAISPNVTFAEEFEAVKTAFDEGRYEQVLPGIREMAERGRSDAQHMLALAYRDGLGLAKDPEIAAVWFERAAASGHVQSQYELGIAYLRGLGVEISSEQAVRWLSKAANAGQTDAAVVLASVLLARGEEEHARMRLQQAAETGHAVAAVRLGAFLESGIGGEPDPSAAAEWYRQGGQEGEPEGVYRWALLKANGPEERVDVMRRAAEAGYSTAQYELAAHLLTAGEVSEGKEGVSWLQTAAESGLPRAQFDLAIVYRDGIAVPSDHDQFRQWITKAAGAGFPKAQYELAVALTDATHGFDEDSEWAFKLYAAAAAVGVVEANYGLGYLLSNGLGVRQDFPEAVERFRTAAEAGHGPSQVALGNLYVNGQGVEESRDLAEKWYCMAARQGRKDAIGFLGGEDKIDAVCSGHGDEDTSHPHH